MAEADKDPKADALDSLFLSLRPLLCKLMKIKGWNARKTSSFLRAKGILIKAPEIEKRLREKPFTETDKIALESFMVNTQRTKENDL